ncbi:MAG TPA: cytochrome P450 [Ktedonobacteraceae bacterium]|nr:cytochrome P450 [Ktedonobacteraceae bacterium]
MQQQPGFRPSAFAHSLPQTPGEIPQTYAWFAQMRAEHPVFYNEQMHLWQIFNYDAVSEVITDYNRFSSERTAAFGDSFLKDTLVLKDPPDHRKLRNLVNQAFTPRAVARLAEDITGITKELLDKVRSRGEMDVVADIAFPLPARVIAAMLGVPSEDWDIFQRWAYASTSDAARARQPNQALSREEIRQHHMSMQEQMYGYFAKLLNERRRTPREDLITALANAEVDGERLSERDLVKFCALLLAAGQETTKNLIANAVLCFTDYPETMQRLRREPDLMPSAIEEVLRYLSPVWFLFRQTTTEVELEGQHIPANQLIQAWLASANRDAAQFPDSDRFDIEREPNRHVAFGHGIHFCVGAPLARLEARIALSMMLEQLQDLQRVANVPITIRTGIVFMIRTLPITFRPY